jgi:hypothetical protein
MYIYIHVVNGWLQVYNDPFIKLSIILKWGTATVGMAFIQWCAKRWMVIGWWLSGVFKSVQVGGTGVPNIVYIYVYICMYIVLILYIYKYKEYSGTPINFNNIGYHLDDTSEKAGRGINKNT